MPPPSGIAARSFMCAIRPAEFRATRHLSEASMNFYGMPWVVRVWPTPDEWTESRNILFALSLIIGLLIYTSGALAVAARRRARTVEWARHQMAVQKEDLRETNERLETVIQASPFAIIATDLTGNVKSWNAAAERIFGWTGDEVIDQTSTIHYGYADRGVPRRRLRAPAAAS